MVENNNIQTRFPFLSGVKHGEKEYIGIIQNSDDKIISFYDYSAIKTLEEKRVILELGEIWWTESNRCLPIHIFLPGQLIPYRYCLRTVLVKDTEILFGPVTSLNNIIQKRIKRKQIQLIRKMD